MDKEASPVENLTDNPFRNRIFPHIEVKVSVKLSDVIDIFDKMRKRSLALEDNDTVRICLLVLLEHGFLGHQLSHNLRDALYKRKVLHDAKREKWGKIQYTMTGFVWAFMIWILDAIPATYRYVHKQPTENIPRALAWELRIPFSWSRCCITKLEGIVATLTETVSSLHCTIGTLESRLLAFDGDAHVSTLTQTVSSLQGTIDTLES
uniref:Phospholipase-like protein n=1 Tax=Tanacetum cinerariifolium TaxID=118510 RepID=A0A6L2LH59_TANCI|nr:phospholipase-like protein [Tanacetum cinerariifolium]